MKRGPKFGTKEPTNNPPSKAVVGGKRLQRNDAAGSESEGEPAAKRVRAEPVEVVVNAVENPIAGKDFDELGEDDLF